MGDQTEHLTQRLIESLMERAKELGTLYRIEELFKDPQQSMPELLAGIVQELPGGWQYPDLCKVKIVYNDQVFESTDFDETQWSRAADIVVRGNRIGEIVVSYSKEMPLADVGSFLNEEVQLLETVANRIAQRALYHQLREMFEGGVPAFAGDGVTGGQQRWRVVLDLLRMMDPRLLAKISRRMLNLLMLRGVGDARRVLTRCNGALNGEMATGESNQPQQRDSLDMLARLCDDTFEVAASHLTDAEILSHVERWVHEDRSRFLTGAVASPNTNIAEIADSIERYLQLVPQGIMLPSWAELGVRVELTRRLLGEQLDFIKIAKSFFTVEDFSEVLRSTIAPVGSLGRLGGKSSGLLLACKILNKARKSLPEIGDIKVPKTWFITADGLSSFIKLNNLEELFEHKYRSISEIRHEYPHIIQVFKSSQMPRDIVKGLALALEDFGGVPLVARSSSLLEDRIGHPFSGKYRSLFVANQGSRQARLESLADAISEVYASVFGPDPIEYRGDRGLLDFNEEMGILLQEVVGRRVGRYWFPALAGVAFSNNEMRWSARVKREDGLVRMVPGLGTRAVDRLTDDYPILIAVGQPELRVNISPDEVMRYSPQSIDVINLEANSFETKDFRDLLAEVDGHYPGLELLLSVYRDGYITPPISRGRGWWRDDIVVTFDGLIKRTGFIRQIRAILTVLQDSLQAPVDIEFAFDGEHLHLLQCRPQVGSDDQHADPIPADIPSSDVVFFTQRYVSNGQVPDLSHLVYVDPLRYGDLSSLERLQQVGVAVGRLNSLLPRRRFALMGPGRWGSRGDIKLGVRVTYSDINNTALLIEVARRKGSYVPDVSFGTHFFQDLVDSAIRYLPLFPDDDGVIFNEELLLGAPNSLAELLPDHADLADTVRVIDIAKATGGKLLRVAMNGDENQALGYLVGPEE
jgi:hypothetical protein